MMNAGVRSLTVAALLAGGTTLFTGSTTNAQWTQSPDTQPIECSSWQTTYSGGMCRAEHFNERPAVNVFNQTGTGSLSGAPGTIGVVVNSGAAASGPNAAPVTGAPNAASGPVAPGPQAGSASTTTGVM